MRRIVQHRFEEDGFSEAVRGLVRNAPWWTTSLLVHALVLLVLWNVRIESRRGSAGPLLEANAPTVEPPPEPPPEFEPPEPDVVEPKIVEAPVEDPSEEPPETDTDNPNEDTAGEADMGESAFTGPTTNTPIGLGPAGGGPPGRGGRRDRNGPTQASSLTEIAVELGLRWLADHQDEDGRWDCDDFAKHDPPDDRCDGPGGALYDPGVSGLALLAFLGAGYTDRGGSENPYADTVRNGLRYLMIVQDEEGCFGARSSQHFIYNHAIATLAMSEAYWMTRNPRYKRPAQQGLDFIAMARNPYLAWRYEPRGGENDTSVTGWMVMALKSGKFGGLVIDPDAFEGARLWIDKMTDPVFGQVGYNMPGGPPARPEGMQDRFPPEKSQSMTAVGVLTRIFLGEDPRTSEPIRKGAALMMDSLPRWNPEDGSIDMYYWYYGTLAMFQVGGKPWRAWNEAMKEAILKHQHPRKSGARTGSWDPIGPWGGDGGRVYATAAMVMCLEVYYRYDRVIGANASWSTAPK